MVTMLNKSFIKKSGLSVDSNQESINSEKLFKTTNISQFNTTNHASMMKETKIKTTNNLIERK